MRAFAVLLLIGSALLNGDIAGAQNNASRDAAQPASPAAASSNIVLPDQEYVIGPTDVVEVLVAARILRLGLHALEKLLVVGLIGV